MKLKKNILFQMINQLITMVLPLIIAPYLTRILGEDKLGIYSFSYSISYIFVLFAMLGIQNHGCRVISKCSNDSYKRRRAFWSLYITHLIFSLVAFSLYIIFTFVITENKTTFIILGIYVASAFFDVTWYYYGVEKVKSILVQNSLIKILELLFIFTFVKKKDDLDIYTVIMASSILLGQIILMPYIIKNNKFIMPTKAEIKEHIKPLFILSISVFASSLYTMFDKTVIGLLIEKKNVAYYDYSEKIVKIPLNLITSIGSVMLSNITKLLNDNWKENREILTNSIRKTFIFVSFFAFAFSFGIAAVSEDFAVYYYGENFAVCGKYIMYLCPVIVIISLGNVLRTQYLLPLKKDYKYIISIVSCSIVNLSINFTLIPVIGVEGAIIGTIVGESVGFILQNIFIVKDIPIGKIYLETIPFFIFGLVMFISLKIIEIHLEHSIIMMMLKILIGMVIYLSLSYIYFKVSKKVFFKRK